jgi:hypothetical protein
MRMFSSKSDGDDFDSIHGGFLVTRQFNVVNHYSRPIEPGYEARALINRAQFAFQKGRQVTPKDKSPFIDRKVWSA